MKNTEFEIALVDASGRSVCISGVAVEVVLLVNGKERYRFDAGDTNSAGVLSTNGRVLEEKRREDQTFFLMDYNSLLSECDPAIVVCVVTPEGFKRRLEAVRKYFPEEAPSLAQRIASCANGLIRADDQYFAISIGESNRLAVVCERVTG